MEDKKANDVLNIELKDMEMETLKFKVGDKVRVKSLEWYNSEKKNERGTIEEGASFTKEMSALCGSVLTIIGDKGNSLYVVYDNSYYWQDWMLEEEAVTEEKQEVEQLNKNSIETKEMTQEEAFAFLNNTKIICTSTKETVKVQEKLFELGFEWDVTGEKIKQVDKYLLFIEGGKLKYTLDFEYWVRCQQHKRIEPSEILSIKLKEDKPKFNPNTLQPFDKVLVKDDGGIWVCNLFSHKKENRFYCVLSNWKNCVPFNDETKHLVGTTEYAPEFYRI